MKQIFEKIHRYKEQDFEEGKPFEFTLDRATKELNTEIEDYTRKWLEKNGIVYDKLVLGAQDKLQAAKENNIDLFIDDSIKHCRNVQSGNIRTLLYTSICNQGVETPDLERAYSWVQIYDKYHKYFQK